MYDVIIYLLTFLYIITLTGWLQVDKLKKAPTFMADAFSFRVSEIELINNSSLLATYTFCLFLLPLFLFHYFQPTHLE